MEVFQSAPLREGRRLLRIVDRGVPAVSIRAPARGATRTAVVAGPSTSSFNPRPCARGDSRPQVAWPVRQSFQSAPLREGRPGWCLDWIFVE